MNEFISIMQDVARLATTGSDLARAEARRLDAERERRAAEQALNLHPAAIVAAGAGTAPSERLITLQSAVGKLVGLLAEAGRLRLKLPIMGVWRFRF